MRLQESDHQLEKIDGKSSQPRHGGKRDGSGRKKGTPNKLTGDLKEMILEALGKEGGVEYLREVAQNDRKAFCALLSRVIPLQVSGEGGGPVVITWCSGD